MLFCFVGDFKTINTDLMLLALSKTPALLLDPANFADIHRFRDQDIEDYANLYVMEVDSLYRFIPSLKRIPKLSVQLGGKEKIKNIFITSFTRLFNYDDEDENNDVYAYAWDIISDSSSELDIYVAVEKDTVHQHLAMVHNARLMGHTTTSQRMMVDQLLLELQKFGKALDENDRISYNAMLRQPLKHLGSIGYASPLRPETFILLSMILEQQKRLDEYERLADRCLQVARQDNTLAEDKA